MKFIETRMASGNFRITINMDHIICVQPYQTNTTFTSLKLVDCVDLMVVSESYEKIIAKLKGEVVEDMPPEIHIEPDNVVKPGPSEVVHPGHVTPDDSDSQSNREQSSIFQKSNPYITEDKP